MQDSFWPVFSARRALHFCGDFILFEELDITQVVEDFLRLFAKWVERISILQICDQRLFF